MSIIAAIALMLLGFLLCVRGGNALGESASHKEYGVGTEGRHKLFSWVFIIAGVLCFGTGVWLIY